VFLLSQEKENKMKSYDNLVKTVGRATTRSPTKEDVIEMKRLKTLGYTTKSIGVVFGKHRSTVAKWLNS